ncbi:MSHA biogenesis protein MshP [Massilia sp. H6]|uniref:MSHA biogenesis protein MshP n=1 Tax=Massilia sp. H6 TaxID=2970464 RepID=UPI00216742BD|nr:MSHA biogenesis protein MshP [Massilia sp. H6]UVW28589.1 MSHA biogenesis protein MshP [Massilia sp. H6]
MSGAVNQRGRQSGFAYIAAVVLLIVVAGVCVALLRLSGTQQATTNQAILGARANLAARAGIEWGFHQLRAGGACFSGQTLSAFNADSGFMVRVDCTARGFNEGESSPGVAIGKTIYTIDALACNASVCGSDDPAIVTQPDYVERRRVAMTCMVDGAPATDC